MTKPFIVMTTAMVAVLMINVPTAMAQIDGKASVVDGDTIEIGAIRVRLFGIDAPEKKQTCQTASGEIYRCGQRSKNYLRQLIARRPVRCEDLGQAKFGRRWGRCHVGKLDLQAAMVQAGHARAYRFHSNEYVNGQKLAKTNQAGIWQGFHVRPGKFRKCWRKGNTPRACSR